MKRDPIYHVSEEEHINVSSKRYNLNIFKLINFFDIKAYFVIL